MLTISVSAALSLAVHATSKAEDIQLVRLGFSGPLSGANAAAGKDALNGMQMAVERLNQQALQIEGKALRFEVVARDDQSNPQRGLEIARELSASRINALLGPFTSGVAMTSIKVYNDAAIPVLTIASNPKVTQANLNYVFRIAASDADIGAKLAQYAARNLKLKSIAVIDDGSVYAQGLIDAFQKSARSMGLQISSREKLSDTADDASVSRTLQTLRNDKAPAIFFGGYAAQGGRLLKAMQQLKMDAMLLGGDALCAADLVRLAGDSLGNNTYCAEGGVWLTRAADGAVFSAGYQRRFAYAPDVYAATYYDGVMLLAQAIKSSGSIAGPQLLPALLKSRYKGVTASYEFTGQRELKESTVTILRFKGSTLVPLASF
ncbi:branched-chain amino acid ABC transporter substrate-binding protein [Herbaspirillum lusitanum]|uniref:Branched-chain amino acid ABC transporter substrate-binding protein n=1 Tax=Herbaspirillum lusitanum TaxID=213312 RepID=A0ABW9AHT1_9BURK